MRPPTTLRRRPWVALLVAVGIALAGCSSDPSPTAPDSGGMSVDPTIPAIPKPTSPRVDAPMESATLTVVRKLGTSFYPDVMGARSGWTVTGRARWTFPAPTCNGAWVTLYQGKGWSDQLPRVSRKFHGCPLLVADQTLSVLLALPPLGRLQLMTNGVIDPPAFTTMKRTIAKPALSWDPNIDLTYKYLAALGTQPYLRRDRRWIRVTLTDGSTSVLLAPNTEASFSTSQTSGIEIEKSRSFSETITGSVGADAAGISASIEQTITTTFTTTTHISKSTTTTTTHTVRGEAGKQTVFMLWGLEETYTITNENGDVFTDPSFTFAPVDPVVVHGITYALDATTFDL